MSAASPIARSCPLSHPPPLPCRALFSADQSFPLAAAFIYSVYQFQQKRIKRDPEGPFFLGNPMAGAVISTVINCALACAVSGSVIWSVSAFVRCPEGAVVVAQCCRGGFH